MDFYKEIGSIRNFNAFELRKGVMILNNDEWQTLKLESYDISVAFMERKDTIEDLFKSKKVVYEKLCSIYVR